MNNPKLIKIISLTLVFIVFMSALIIIMNKETSPIKNQKLKLFSAYASDDCKRLRVFGRVIKSKSETSFESSFGRLRYFVTVVKLFLAKGSKNTKVYFNLSGEDHVFTTNKYGHFTALIESDKRLIEKSEESSCTFTKVHAFLRAGNKDFQKKSVDVIHPYKSTTNLIISDIDDTVVKSRATSFIRMAIKTLINPPRKRKIFPEVTETYKALEVGKSKSEKNLFFYVSNSSWNLHPILKEFFNMHDLPKGPLLLQDVYGEMLNEGYTKHQHKIKRIDEVLNFYKEQKVILIGDAGQADQRIYLDAAKNHPGRISKIYIRKPWWKKIFEDPKEFLDEAKDLGVELVYFSDMSSEEIPKK